MFNENGKVERKSAVLATVLVAYVYVPYFTNFWENTFKISSLSGYIIYVILALIAIVPSMRVNMRVLIFFLILCLTISVNFVVVSYRYYVFIEGVQALVSIAVPCLCISNDKFDLGIFIDKWWKFSKLNLPLVFATVVFLRQGFVHYSIFTSICVPNVFINSYMLLQGTEKRGWLYFNVTSNILITAILGGRMAAVISVCMIFFGYFFSGETRKWRKVIIIAFMSLSAFFLLNNLIDFLYWLSKKLAQYGMQSRSVTLLINQIKNDEIYLTNRDYIYTACVEYIKERIGLPGGFGIPLYITSGEYYYAHNVFLQACTLFGVWGTIIILEISLIRAKVIKHIAPLKCRKFIYFMLLCYLGIGMTGSSIWIHYLSTIFIAIFYFGNSRLYKSIEVS